MFQNNLESNKSVKLVTIILILPMRKLRSQEEREPRISTTRIWNQIYLVLKTHLLCDSFLPSRNSAHSMLMCSNTLKTYILKTKTKKTQPEFHKQLFRTTLIKLGDICEHQSHVSWNYLNGRSVHYVPFYSWILTAWH